MLYMVEMDQMKRMAVMRRKMVTKPRVGMFLRRMSFEDQI
jgi:hypothetical protein